MTVADIVSRGWYLGIIATPSPWERPCVLLTIPRPYDGADIRRLRALGFTHGDNGDRLAFYTDAP